MLGLFFDQYIIYGYDWKIKFTSMRMKFLDTSTWTVQGH